MVPATYKHQHVTVEVGFEIITALTMKSACLPLSRLIVDGFWLGLLVDPEPGSSMFLRNVGGILPGYTDLHPPGQYSPLLQVSEHKVTAYRIYSICTKSLEETHT
jgi:hypothetical protein